MQRLIRDHAHRWGVIAAAETPFEGRARSALTLTAAARMLPVGYKTARDVIAGEGLIPRGSRRGVTTHIPSSHMPRIRAQVTKSTTVGVAHLLGIGRGQARALMKTLYMSKLRQRSSEAAVAHLLSDLSRLEPAQQLHGSARRLPLPRACQAAGVPIAEAVVALLAGRIGIDRVDPDALGLSRIIVCADIVRTLKQSGSALKVCDVARQLAVHPEAARNLIERGFLSRGNRRVDSTSVALFSQKFVPGAKLALALGTSPKAAAHWLKGWGLEPAIAPPACRATFFDRRAAICCLEALGAPTHTMLEDTPSRDGDQ